MNGACEAIKEPVQEIFRKFAFLDIELRSTKQEFVKSWSLCTRVRCGEKDEFLVLLMASPELAVSVTNNFLGIDGGSRPGQRIDIVSELTNVLAGKAYEILRAGAKPTTICTPELLESVEASGIWNMVPTECRFAICSENDLLGGLMIFAKSEWSRP